MSKDYPVIGDSTKEEQQPRFRRCEAIKCSYCYDCKERLEVHPARDIGTWGLDYYCPQGWKNNL